MSTKRIRFTQRAIEALPAQAAAARAREAEYSDTEVTGLKLAVSKAGRKFFALRYSYRGAKQSLRLGEFGVIDVAEARRRALAALARLDAGEDPRAEKVARSAMPTFAEFVQNDVLPHFASYKRSADDDAAKCRLYLLPAFGPRRLADVTTRDLQGYLDRLKTEHGLADATVNRHGALLSKLFGLAVEWGVLTKSPFQGIRKRKENNQRQRYLSLDEIQRLYRAMEHEPNRTAVALVKLLLATGVRRGEAQQARWEHVDLDAGLWYLPKTKAQKSRHVVLNEEARAVLAGLPGPKAGLWVFPGRDPAKPLNNPKKAFDRILAAAGVDHIVLHGLRHSFAALAINEGGATLYEVQNLLGHASAQTTQRYAHLAAGTLREASGAVARAIGAAVTRRGPGAAGGEEAAA